MATAFAPSVIIGERPDRGAPRRFQAARRAVRHLTAEEGAGDRIVPGPDATLASLAAELSTAPASTVTLLGDALPAALQGRLALALLRRQADRGGKRLLLATDTRAIRRVAEAVGLAVVPATATLEAAEDGGPTPSRLVSLRLPAPLARQTKLHWPASLSRAAGLRLPGALARPAGLRLPALPRPGAGGLRSPFVLGALALALLWLAWTVVPAARVTLTPTHEPWAGALPLTVDPALKRPDAASGRLPGRTISKELSETMQAPATGRRIVPDAPATGQVVFINKADKPVAVPKGTAVLAGAVRFQTREDVTVAASVAAGLQQRVGMGRVAVVAAQGGPAANVDRFQINRIEGALAPSLEVQNDAPTRGGTEKQVAYVTAEDRRRLQEALQRTLTERLMQQVKGQLPSADKETVIPWAGANPHVLEAAFTRNAEEEGPSVGLTMKLRFGATVFGNDAYNALVRQAGGARLAQERQGFEAVPETLKPEPPEVLGIENGVVRLNGRASATVRPRLETGALRRALASGTADEGRAYLATLPGVAAHELRVWPAWPGRLPGLGARIEVVVLPAPTQPAASGTGAARRSAPNGP